MLTFERIAIKPVVFQMLTGLSLQAFLDLLPKFHLATTHIEHQAEQRRKQPRKRQKGDGRKLLLCSDADRLLFMRFYFKVYPLQAVQAFFFGMSQAPVNADVHRRRYSKTVVFGTVQTTTKRLSSSRTTCCFKTRLKINVSLLAFTHEF
jgi:hypothetical protein